tara:strand:+ start:2676 stop:2894 length:219 start_codon:yes stop_codon:yes gene_type:complete
MAKIIKIDKEKLRGVIWGKQKKVAVKMDMHPVSLSRKINGTQPMSIEELNTIMRIIDRDVSDFVVIEDETKD